MKTYYLLLILFFFVFKTGKTQFIECQTDNVGYWADKYKITAQSGLKLRTEPILNSQVVTVIPFGFEVRICERNAIRDTIDEIAGKWVKTYWREYEGFMFDGYLERVFEEYPILSFSTYWDLVNDWKDFQFERNEEVYGLYRVNDYQKVELQKVKFNNSIDEKYSYPLEPDNVPAFVIRKSKLDLIEGTRFTEINRMLFIGDHISWLLYGDGKIHKKDSLDLNTYVIDPYELRVSYQTKNENGEFEQKNELLLKMKYHTCNVCGGRAVINYIGDVDGDDKDDIIITYNSTYKGWYYGLFSTKYAKVGRMFKEFTIGQGSE